MTEQQTGRDAAIRRLRTIRQDLIGEAAYYIAAHTTPERARETATRIADAVLPVDYVEEGAGLLASTPDTPAASADVVEVVARALHDHEHGDAQWDLWKDIQDFGRNYWLQRADVAIRAHYAAHHTPYADEEHQGGNLLDLYLKAIAKLFRLENPPPASDLASLRAYLESTCGISGDQLDAVQREILNRHKAFELMLGEVRAQRDEARRAVIEVRDV